MAGVFLSYDREDSDRARQLAQALEKAGHEVFWDLHVRGGAQFSKVIEEALKAANAVVVLWSRQSIESAWVKDEAAVGRDTGRLVPVTIDGTEPPLGFRQFQTIDLSGSKGRGRSAGMRMLLDDVAATAGPSTQDGRRAAPATPAPTRRNLIWPVAAAAAVLAVLAAGLLWWQPWRSREITPIVAVTAADSTPGSRALARDLLVQLGKLQATNPDALKLVSSTSEHPGLILQASASDQAQNVTAGLTLLGGKNGTLLWSKDYSQPRDRQSDLRQQVAYSAAQVLQCAGEALNAGEPLNEDLRKVYLNGCAEFGEGSDMGPLIDLFEKVTKGAPSFKPAWEKLLLASADAASEFDPYMASNSDARKAVSRYISEAERRFPDLPEILLAKSDLLPLEAYGERMAMLDRAKHLAPTSSAVLDRRSQELMSVGRMDEAVEDARQALQLDPLSPALSDSLVSALAYSGAFSNAEETLANAKRLWPGSSSVTAAEFRFNLRYGDPRVALELLRKNPDYRGNEPFLNARIDPSPANVKKAIEAMRAGAGFYKDYSFLAQTLAEFHREDELYHVLLEWKAPHARSGFEVLFRPQFKKFRQDPRFMELANKAGLVTYWRTSGHWPDFCFDADLPYDCKKEAAKLGG